jgi:hypothetical protein
MGLLRRKFHGYELDDSRDSFITTEFISLWKLPIWPVATHRVFLNRETSDGVDAPGKQEMAVVATDKIQVAHGLLFTFFAFLLVVFTAAVVVVAMKRGLYAP